MSIHRSLKATETMKRHRSVLSRLERVRILQEKGTLDTKVASALGLPKVKHLRIRIKKEKVAAAAAGTAAAPGAATPSTEAAGTKSKK